MTKENEILALSKHKHRKNGYLISRYPELKRSIHLKGIYCSENARF